MHVRRITAAAAVAAAGSLAVVSGVVGIAAAADAAAPARPRISVFVSDSTPASGQQFVVRGKFFVAGDPAEDRPVKVQTLRNGSWTQLTGARVTTNDDGAYRVRVILSQTGARELRIVGVSPQGSRNAFHTFGVTVH